MSPAEGTEFRAAYLQALTDDAANPLGADSSRVALLESAQAKRPAHLFGKETVAHDQKVLVLEGEENPEAAMKANSDAQVKKYYSVISPNIGQGEKK